MPINTATKAVSTKEWNNSIDNIPNKQIMFLNLKKLTLLYINEKIFLSANILPIINGRILVPSAVVWMIIQFSIGLVKVICNLTCST